MLKMKKQKESLTLLERVRKLMKQDLFSPTNNKSDHQPSWMYRNE